MSTVTIRYPNTIRERSASNVGLRFILIIVVSANADRMGQAPVAQHSIMAVPVPTP